jgi:hypothetical protein
MAAPEMKMRMEEDLLVALWLAACELQTTTTTRHKVKNLCSLRSSSKINLPQPDEQAPLLGDGAVHLIVMVAMVNIAK